MTPSASAHRWTTWVKTSGTWRLFGSTSTAAGWAVNNASAVRAYGATSVKSFAPIFKQH